MSPTLSWPLRCGAVLLAAQLVLACGGGGGQQPPPPSDLTPPTTRVTPAGGEFTNSVAVTLTCDDGSGSGCAATYYTLDGTTPGTGSTQYREPFTLGSTTTVRFYSLDAAGNAEAPGTVTFTLVGAGDTAAPTTVASPAGGAFNSPRNVTLTCSDGEGSGCAATHYTLDGSVPTLASPRYTAPVSISTSATLRFFSVDRVGNLEAVQQARYVVDTQAPQVVAAPRGGGFTTSRAVTLSCDDGEGSGCAAIHYTTNGSLPSLDSAIYQEPLLLTATTRVRFIAVDFVGNVSDVVSEQYTRDASVEDRTAPTTVASPAGGVYWSAQSVVLSCTDDAVGSGCAGTYYTVDGSAPTTSSIRYTGPVSVTPPTTLRFFSMDLAGNVEVAKSEQYTLDTTPPVTTASPSGGVYQEAVSVTLACSDTASGCAETRYTLDGSSPTASSPRYEGPITLTRTLMLRFASTDVAGNVESAKQESYVLPELDRQASEQILAVRNAVNGTVNLVIHGAWITYIKQGVGNLANDPAGFFLQAERTGPALFVPVDPSTLTPVPHVGDRVRVTVNAKNVVNGQVRATLSGLSVLSRDASVSALLQDVSAVDVTSGGTQPDYESEYVSITGTIGAPGFSASGDGHLQAPLTTVGVPSGSTSAASLRLRLVEPLRDDLALTSGCEVTVTSPLWVFMSGTQTRPAIQASGWKASDVTVRACPAPRVINAWAPGRNTVMVRFGRPLEPTSLVANGSQFSISGLNVTQARLETDTVVALTTSDQAPRQSYAITVATTIRDRLGVHLDSMATQTTFAGYVRTARLRLSEVAPNVPNGRDLVELLVREGGSTGGATLMDGNATLATLPDVEVAAGDIIVVHLNPDRVTPGVDAPASETLGKTQYPASSYSSNYDNAWDFHGTTLGVGTGNRTLRIRDAFEVTQDGVALVVTGNTFAGYPALLQALQSEGHWFPTTCSGVPCTYESSPSALDVSFDWGMAFYYAGREYTLQRNGTMDNGNRGDWKVDYATLGAPNLH
ncbi:Beta-hexosaminidase [Myxococcus hansupus]|uniref:Beta-hexosaminidase n=1 Tax=Pseudomyxococcus hansupus TaxID=1297742 RepID=A0A0H4WUW5_9BACT|nr:chitobiase/beta-hexosaminidase C-terminal domain-containing protein [Myxococcus hansupus]AKQ65388.1 Beta-hexosaminidase [Myxococcus hansupus]